MIVQGLVIGKAFQVLFKQKLRFSCLQDRTSLSYGFNLLLHRKLFSSMKKGVVVHGSLLFASPQVKMAKRVARKRNRRNGSLTLMVVVSLRSLLERRKRPKLIRPPR